jgi:predicted naringenin-chalcone synthase
LSGEKGFFMKVFLHAIGTANPPYAIEQQDAARIAETMVGHNADTTRATLNMLFRNSRVRQRHSVVLQRGVPEPPQQSFFPPARDPHDRGPTTEARMRCYGDRAQQLATLACSRALQRADMSASRVTHVVAVTCTGFQSPGLDLELIRQLGLAPSVTRVQIGFMGCHGALNGLRVARAFADADPQAVVLICAVELCSLHYQYGYAMDKLVANALFADGAAAVVLSREVPHEPAAWKLVESRSHLFPNSWDAMTWRIGDHGFEMSLSPQVPQIIADSLAAWLHSYLEPLGLSPQKIGSWAIHPGGPRIVHSVCQALGLPDNAASASLDVLATYGNMSSPTVLFVLDQLQQQAANRPCLALAFGPGLVVEAALFR